MAQAVGPRPAPALVALLLTLVTLAARAQTFGNPILGFDEQFYLLVGDRMLHGALPYVNIFDRKPIGLFLIYAACRLLGGEGTLQYQLVAAATVALTAGLVYRFARRLAPWPGALAAAVAYIAWLNLTEGEGGQSPVFYNLPITLAALLTARALERPRQQAMLGAAAMLAIGLAIQIKYTVVFEGMFFGTALLWAGWRAATDLPRLAALGMLWATLALAPTIAALLAYAHLGALDQFLFGNFRSIGGRLPDPTAARLTGLAVILAILAPFALAVRLRAPTPAYRFVLAWAAAALAGMLGFGAFLAPHYAQPLLAPLVIAAAPLFAARPRAAAALLAVALIAGQIVLFMTERAKGGRAEALALAAAARPRHGGCLYVYDGPPALYRLTGSCLPTRFAFPGHLDTANEATVAALGVDPLAEVRRILATHPETIVDTHPAYALGNPATRSVVEAALARDYRLALALRTGGRTRLVYWRRERTTK